MASRRPKRMFAAITFKIAADSLEQVRAALRGMPPACAEDATMDPTASAPSHTGLGLCYVAPSCRPLKGPLREDDPQAAAFSVKHWRSACPRRPVAHHHVREGTNAKLQVALCRVRVRAARSGVSTFAERHCSSWPKGEPPHQFWLATVDRTCRPQPHRYCQAALAHRTRLSRPQAGNRSRAYEGRGWQGFHHHGSCQSQLRFLISERRGFPPQDHIPPLASKKSAVPSGYRPAAPVRRTPRHNSNRNDPACWLSRLQRTLQRCQCCIRKRR